MGARLPTEFDTVELLKRSMAAVAEANVPAELRAVALQIAAVDLRRAGPAVPGERAERSSARSRSGSSRPAVARSTSFDAAILNNIPDEREFFAAIENETGVVVSDLCDIFHIEDATLGLKVSSKSLGGNRRAQMQTVTALLAGAVFAGTPERKLSFSEINQVCQAKHCFDPKHAAENIKETAGFGSVGAGKSQAVVTKGGWQDAFAAAARRVLGRPDPGA